MDVKIGNGRFRLVPEVTEFADKNLLILIERADTRVSQIRHCDGRPSDPNPLKSKIRAETDLMFFSPLDPGASVTDHGYSPSSRQRAEMGRMLRRFLTRSRLPHPSRINEAIQSAFGSYEFEVPWDGILDDVGRDHAITVLTVVQYRRFTLPQAHSGAGRVLLSIPFSVRHFVRILHKCSEDGLFFMPSIGSDIEFPGTPAKPKTDRAKAARSAFEKARRAVLERELEAIREKLKQLDAEHKLLTGE